MEIFGDDAKCNQKMPSIPRLSLAGAKHSVDITDNQLVIGAYGITDNSWKYLRHSDPRGNLLSDLWTESTSLGTSAPVHHQSFVFGKDLVFLGGVHGSQAVLQNSKNEDGQWNALRLKWKNGSSFNFFTEDACVVKVKRDEFVILGGKVTGKATSLVLMVNMKEQTVEELGSLIFARYLHACATTSEPTFDAIPGDSTYKNSIVVTGGLGPHEFGIPVEIFNVSLRISKKAEHSMKNRRCGHQMAVLGNRVFAFGGRQHSNNSDLNTIEMFNANTESWTLHPERLLSKATHGLALTTLPLSTVACNRACKCGDEANARIIGGTNAKVSSLTNSI